LKNTKTTNTTPPNAHNYTDRDATPTRCPPPFQPTALTHATPLPYLPITPPPQCIDFDVLKASILAGLIQDQTKFQMMMLTTMPMPMMQPMMMMTDTTAKTL